MTDKKTEALKLALEALEKTQDEGYNLPGTAIREAITAIREALAEQSAQQERNFCQRCGKRLGTNDWDVHTCTPPASKPLPDEPVMFKGVLPFGSTPTEPGLWLSFNDSRTYVWQETGWIEAATQPAQQSVQAPVAWITRRTADGGVYVDGYETCESTDYGAIPVYTTPPAQQQWVGLTDEEMHACWDSPLTPLGMKHVRMIEAKLKQKNT